VGGSDRSDLAEEIRYAEQLGHILLVCHTQERAELPPGPGEG
jgi:hypothetical protein